MVDAASRTSYDATTAIVVVDVQNDFAHPEGNLYVEGGQDVIPVINQEVASARRAGGLVVYTQDWHPESTPHFAKDGGTWPVHCVQETWGAAFADDLEVVEEGSVTIRKGTGGEDGYSGFTVEDPETGERESTRLDAMLKEHHVDKLVVVGLAQDVCVKETVLDATRLGYATRVLADATRPVNLRPGDGDASLRAMNRAGAEIVGGG